MWRKYVIGKGCDTLLSLYNEGGWFLNNWFYMLETWGYEGLEPRVCVDLSYQKRSWT